MALFSVHPRFEDFMVCFKLKNGENDFAHPPCFFRWLHCGSNFTGYECAYGLRYPAFSVDHQRVTKKLTDWSSRQLALYQKLDTVRGQTRWIFVGVPQNIEILIGKHLKQDLGIKENLCNLHLALLEFCVSSWKSYLAYLFDIVKEKSQEFLFMKHDDLKSFQSRRDLKRLEDDILDLPLMLRSICSTIKSLNDKFTQSAEELSDSPSPNQSMVDRVSFEDLLEETKLLLKRVEILEKRVKSVSTITWDSMVHLNGLSMMNIAKDTKEDSAAMKIITVITVLFLPATFVATFFSTQFVVISNEEFHFSKRIWVYFAVTIPLTFFTIVVWLIGMRTEKIKQHIRSRSQSEDEDSAYVKV